MTVSPGQPSHEQASPRPAENTVNAALTPKRRRPVTENSGLDVGPGGSRPVVNCGHRQAHVPAIESW
jgi:hypothetical protein